MAKGKTNKYDDLSDEFKNAAEGANDDQLMDMLGVVAKNEELNRRCKEDDQDLAEKKKSYDSAAVGYKDATKANKLKTRFIYDLLRARGKAE